MAVKTFVVGEVLTSDATNTYLANSGLVFVKSQTVGSGVSSVTVSNAFSATYDNYRIISSGITYSVDNNVRMTLDSANGNYYGSLIYGSYAGGSPINQGDSNTAYFTFGGSAGGLVIDLLDPFSAFFTEITSRIRYGTVYGTYTGVQAQAISRSSFTLTPNSGTMAGGTITVYGYRKA